MGYFKTLFVEALDGFVEHESTPSVKEMLAVAVDRRGGDDIRGDVTSKQEGDDMENKETKESQGETHETVLEKMVEGMGINVYRPAIAETLKEMAGEVPDAVITSTEEFDREVKGMKEGNRTYMDVRNAYAKLKDACGDLDWTKAIVKMAAKITKACAKQDIEEAD